MTRVNSDQTSAATATSLSVAQFLDVTAMIAGRTSATPHAPALGSEAAGLSYRELEARSNSLAARLRDLGVSADVAVGVYLDRGPDFAAAALGVLKSGGSYLPLDPQNPAERIRFMVQDAGAPLVIVNELYAKQLAIPSVVQIDIDVATSRDARPDFSPSQPGPDDIAYVIYTSGSTGQPKGVQVPHRALANLVHWHCRAFAVTPQDRASQVASLGFDAAVWEIWPYLCAGASVHFAPETIRADAEALRDWLLGNRIAIGFVPTPIAETMLRLAWPAQSTLRTMLVGGDKLHHHPRPGLPFTVVNNYGPTETAVVATSAPVAPSGDPGAEPSIGAPIDNFEILILDEQMCPVPNGSIGEIYIGGPGLARGYVNRPDLTERRFVANPLDPSGSRLYRTGDLGFFFPNGEIAFRGRIDEQIKIRGYRIEPNEIVAALQQHGSVQSAAILARDGGEQGTQLVAYLVSAHGTVPNAGGLREFLREKLPDYMVPTMFIAIDALPLTANGKIDRAALQSMPGTVLREQPPSAPTTPTVEQLLTVVRELLGVADVTPVDNFFLLGGHSLLGAQLIAKVRALFGVELTLVDVFDNGTVFGMAAEIERLQARKVA
jgi:amino acid adenylation domain-containing protein